MAVRFLLTMKGTKQGNIKGSSQHKDGDLDYSTGMECHGFEYPATTQISPNSGNPVGRRRHDPITIRKEIDAASPKLLQALTTNEVFTNIKLAFNRIGPDGKPIVAHTIELTNGTICEIKRYAGPGPSGKPSQDVTLVFDGLLVNGVRDGYIPPSRLR